MKNCPQCGLDLDGKLIYETFLEQYHGDAKQALFSAQQYGATMTTGRWRREYTKGNICICSSCGHQWSKDIKPEFDVPSRLTLEQGKK
jgi:hypothetical protein